MLNVVTCSILVIKYAFNYCNTLDNRGKHTYWKHVQYMSYGTTCYCPLVNELLLWACNCTYQPCKNISHIIKETTFSLELFKYVLSNAGVRIFAINVKDICSTITIKKICKEKKDLLYFSSR